MCGVRVFVCARVLLASVRMHIFRTDSRVVNGQTYAHGS